jgi:hypothetical protein
MQTDGVAFQNALERAHKNPSTFLMTTLMRFDEIKLPSRGDWVGQVKCAVFLIGVSPHTTREIVSEIVDDVLSGEQIELIHREWSVVRAMKQAY